jgi:2-polyprenyl-3-methyl-5-hydroxy-6-metoxy-1,4-benzoquinol methylase
MTYDFAFGVDTPYAKVLDLVGRHRSSRGEVVVDLGCGHGAVAEPLSALGLTYLGVDSERAGLKDLEERQMEFVAADLSDPGELLAKLEEVLAGRRVAAFCMLDVIEHLTNADAVLEHLRRFAQASGGPPLIASVPNVTHLDLAVKLLVGRWDVTPTGLLDDTHVRFFSEQALYETMLRAGWAQIDQDDFELRFSDQHFPAEAVPLERSTSIGALLGQIRQHAAPGAFVNQFVRAYLPCEPPVSVHERRPGAGGATQPEPFVSVLVRTRGERQSMLTETLLSLAAQTCDDFEVLVLAHDVTPQRLESLKQIVEEFHESFSERIRLLEVHGGRRARPLNEGARAARGRYLAVMDDDDLALAHWVSVMRDTADRAPGHVLRVGVARQLIAHKPDPWRGAEGYVVLSRPRSDYPMSYDHVDHIRDNYTPNCGYAIPRSFFADLGEGWDETLAVYEDWEYLLRAASLCGSESAGIIVALVRWWEDGASSRTVHDEQEWAAARAAVISGFDAKPLLLPTGSMSRLRLLLQSEERALSRSADLERRLEASAAELESVKSALADTRGELCEMKASTSWRATAGARWLTGMARRVRGALKRR